MITYVNTVFVSNESASSSLITSIPTAANAASAKGKIILMDVDTNAYDIDANTGRFKIGIITGKTYADHLGVKHTDIRWSNVINVADIKKVSNLSYPGADTEDTVTIDFTSIDSNVLAKLAQGGKRLIVRLTFKDLPNRYRKWTESYEYVTSTMDLSDGTAIAAAKAKISSDLANLINKEWKRARVTADGTTTAGKLVLTAMPYDDDNSVDALNWANKVRFNANIYYTDPAAEGWESLNKNYPTGVQIDKEPGTQYAASAKLVRDREAQAMGYDGILNRGEGTWPIIKPAMETSLSGTYDAITLEFENMYRAADDIFRKTKQTVEIYTAHAASSDLASAIVNKVKTAMGTAVYNAKKDATTEKGNIA